jgi:hypothetical protein
MSYGLFDSLGVMAQKSRQRHVNKFTGDHWRGMSTLGDRDLSFVLQTTGSNSLGMIGSGPVGGYPARQLRKAEAFVLGLPIPESMMNSS